MRIATAARYSIGAACLIATGMAIPVASSPGIHGPIAAAAGQPCRYEDSVNCYWDARLRGNGLGHSFYSVRIGADDCLIYWDAAAAVS